MARSQNYLVDLVRRLIGLGGETEWVEFKADNSDPKEIGKNISALANGAALHDEKFGYLLWGIEDETWRIVGTSFKPGSKKVGNQPLESWLLQLLNPKVQLNFYEVEIGGQTVVLLEIERATGQPVRFGGNDYVRIGQVTKLMKESPNRERRLWRVFDQTPFEELVAKQNLSADDVFELLDDEAYCDLLPDRAPGNREAIIDWWENDGIVRCCEEGGWDITNLGALLLARDLKTFPNLKRKAVRVIQYRGGDRLHAFDEAVKEEGYANGFEKLVQSVNELLPKQGEIFENGRRRAEPVYPKLAVRELIANMLIHQDFSITGTGPMIEIFDARVEFTNAGDALVAPIRFLDMSQRSRNEAMAGLMRRFGICEERGSGVDRVVSEVEAACLPAPLFEVPGESTRSTLFGPRNLLEMNRNDRIRACYLHACLCFVAKRDMNNATLRARFGIGEEHVGKASMLLREALEADLIRVRDPEVGRRYRCYVPFWAVSSASRLI